MDIATRAIVTVKLSNPRTCWRISPFYLPNHESWELVEVKRKLGKKMGWYFCQGALEFVPHGQDLPTL